LNFGQGGLNQFLSFRRLFHHPADPIGQEDRVAFRHQQPGTALFDGIFQSSHPGGDHWSSAGHGFQGDHPERFIARGKDQGLGGGIKVGQQILTLGSPKGDPVLQFQLLHHLPQSLHLPALPLGVLIQLTSDDE